ncbi:GFA family protein [Candidatus Enterococcus murrayae]|uniref:GFA family protein n=1 Tax=Candidatus Enterococcus murrayae TaxID=2815321 RepID=A0ABS3HJH1_9ENTE|nr:GFA family protein [Enterococcus sp. MJM16]MBO0453074.1 GFA family protein [Enterococcus sp. MJM16]
MELAGQCLCGKVSITIPKISEEITVCHCHMCQKFFGGPFMALEGVLPENFTLNGEEQIQRFMSSEWAERGSCKACGSSLFYHGLADNEYYFPVGLFAEIDHAKLTEEIFYDQKPAFFHYKEPTEKLTEAAFLQKLFADSE